MIAYCSIGNTPEDFLSSGFLFLGFALVGAVSEFRFLLTMVETLLHFSVVDGCFRDFDGMDESLRVRANVRLHAEVPLVALLRLMHLRIALALPVLRAWRCCHNRRIGDGAMLHRDPPHREEIIHNLEETFLQSVLLQQMAKVEDRGFVGNTVAKEINAKEFLERIAIVDCNSFQKF